MQICGMACVWVFAGLDPYPTPVGRVAEKSLEQ